MSLEKTGSAKGVSEFLSVNAYPFAMLGGAGQWVLAWVGSVCGTLKKKIKFGMFCMPALFYFITNLRVNGI